MTVQYMKLVSTATRNVAFLRTLTRWKGSIYKVVWMSLLLYMMLFFFLAYLYRFVMDRPQQIIFERLSGYCRIYARTIPLSFILGFYVGIVVDRWWGQYLAIPWPDGLGIAVVSSVKGTSEQSRLVRRSIMRYTNLAFVLAMQLVCQPCKERFPTYEHMVEAGLLLPVEQDLLEKLDDESDLPKYWVPLVWAANAARRARKDGRVYEDIALNYVVNEICAFRAKLQELLCYDWVCIPVVYTQAVTLAVYLYFLASLMAKQFLISLEHVNVESGSKQDMEIFFPVFLFIEFFFYMGWLNVAETLVNPFGSDDDDFEINYLIDRHLQVSYEMVDDVLNLVPETVEDKFWDGEIIKSKLNEKLKQTETFMGSADKVKVDAEEAAFKVDKDDGENISKRRSSIARWRSATKMVNAASVDQRRRTSVSSS